MNDETEGFDRINIDDIDKNTSEISYLRAISILSEHKMHITFLLECDQLQDFPDSSKINNNYLSVLGGGIVCD